MESVMKKKYGKTIYRTKDIAPNREALVMLFRIREEINSFIEEMEIMSDPELVKGIKEGLKDIDEGRVTELKSVDDLDGFFGNRE